MKTFAAASVLILAIIVSADGQSCAEKAKSVPPAMPDEVRLEYSRNLEIAAHRYVMEPSAENLIWYARRKGYLGHYKDAIEALTIGMEKHPGNPRLYRHRGHRYLTLRCLDDAIKDFEEAARLVKGKADEVEPDGLPNAKGIPTSTLQSNIWYHLGLAYYLKRDYAYALRAYDEAQKVSTNPDMKVATSYWHYMTLRRMGRRDEAEKVLEPFAGDVEVIENTDYLKLIRLNRGEARAEDLLSTIKGDADTLGSASLGYGIGNYFLFNGDREKAMTVFQKIVEGNQWASFGYIAAEFELFVEPRK